jgi:hypothetical protein
MDLVSGLEIALLILYHHANGLYEGFLSRLGGLLGQSDQIARFFLFDAVTANADPVAA